ncbi:phage tail tape measure protein [Microbacterium sp. MYb72]|uniref:phage tail tape measure protein n=1 Tax=Microbacterium sp. MYb72 TaxID=1848693 RepID=UPI000CFC30D9|nr:phage tail tape measure protein [Microbacterium sp. MYb72]PRB02759.1 phage tail tape measure protein [Microbacterium sp. MYb72]
MAERVVKVRLVATVDEYRKGMADAAEATRTVGTQAEKLAQTRQALTLLGTAGVAMGAAIVAGVGIAVAKFAEFDKAMSNVQAVSHASAEDIGLLRQAALDLGASTVFSATEAAGAIEELAKAGVSTADILNGGLAGALDLAAAGGLGVAEAAGIAATTMQQFGLAGSDASHVADLLAAGAGKAMGDVTDMSQALAQGGLVANQFGVSVDETVGTLSAFASAGLLGSDAGTSFRTMLLRLANPSGEAAEKMRELGINAYDAQGNFVGMAGLAGQLETSMKGLTQEQRNAALAIIFGQDAIRGANVLLAEGKNGINDWTDAVNDQGYAAETAATRLDNLIGDWEQFNGALDTAMITMGESANGPLRAFVQGLTNLVDAFNGLPDGAQQAVLAGSLAVGAMLLAGGTAMLMVPKIAEFKTALETMKWSMKGVSLVGGGVFIALTALVAVIGAVSAAQAEARARASEYADAIRAGGDAAEDFIAEQLAMKDSFMWMDRGSAVENARKLGISLEEVTDAVKGTSAEYETFRDRVSDAYAAAGKTLDAGYAMEQLENKVASLREAEEEARGQIDDTGAARDSLTASTEDQTRATELAATAYMDETAAVQSLSDELVGLIDRINEANGVGQDAVTANARWQEALAGLGDQVAKNGTSLNEASAAGSANAASLADVAKAAQDAAKAQFEQDQATMSAEEATQKYVGTLGAQRQAFIDAAIQAGYNATEVQALADKVFALPDAKEISIISETAAAQQKIDQFVTLNSGRRVKVHVDVEGNQSFRVGSVTVSANAAGGYYSGGVKAFAGSGFEPGIYPYRPGGMHKFAEEYDEAYISLDPARQARSKQVWVRTGQELGMFGGGFGGGSTDVASQLIGLAITGQLEIGGDGLVRIIDGRIVSLLPSSAATRSQLGR